MDCCEILRPLVAESAPPDVGVVINSSGYLQFSNLAEALYSFRNFCCNIYGERVFFDHAYVHSIGRKSWATKAGMAHRISPTALFTGVNYIETNYIQHFYVAPTSDVYIADVYAEKKRCIPPPLSHDMNSSH